MHRLLSLGPQFVPTSVHSKLARPAHHGAFHSVSIQGLQTDGDRPFEREKPGLAGGVAVVPLPFLFGRIIHDDVSVAEQGSLLEMHIT